MTTTQTPTATRTYSALVDKTVTNPRRQRVLVSSEPENKYGAQLAFRGTGGGDSPEDFCRRHNDKILGYDQPAGLLRWELKVEKQLDEQTWECRWHRPDETAVRKRRAKSKHRYQLKRPGRAQVVCRVRCCNAIHTIALVKGRLVLCDHPKDELRADIAATALAGSDKVHIACLQVLQNWRERDKRRKTIKGYNLPDKLWAAREQTRIPVEGRPYTEHPRTRHDGKRSRPHPLTKEAIAKWQENLLQEAVTREVDRLLRPFRPEARPTVVRHDRYYDALRYDHDDKDRGFVANIPTHSWVKTVRRLGMAVVGDYFVTRARLIATNLYYGKAVNVRNAIKGSGDTEEVVIRQEDGAWKCYPVKQE